MLDFKFVDESARSWDNASKNPEIVVLDLDTVKRKLSARLRANLRIKVVRLQYLA
jgi:hypothetical protein